MRYLWNEFEFPEDKARARGLTNLSTEVADLLKELTTAGKRLGGLHAASGRFDFRSARTVCANFLQ